MLAIKHTPGIVIDFETEGRRHEKLKTEVTMASQKEPMSYKNVKKEK